MTTIKKRYYLTQINSCADYFFGEFFLTFNFSNFLNLKRSFNQFYGDRKVASPKIAPPPPISSSLEYGQSLDQGQDWGQSSGGNLPGENFPSAIFIVGKKLCRNLVIYNYKSLCISDIHVCTPVYLHIVRRNINQEAGVVKITKDRSCH